MSRTTISRITSRAGLAAGLPAAALMLALAAGCSGKYGHERLGSDSPEAAKVRKMLDDLRAAGEGGLDQIVRTQGADGLDEAKTKMLHGTLLELAKADSAELKQMDRFGKDVWRAVFEVTASGGKSSVAVLLVIPKDGRPRWAGRN